MNYRKYQALVPRCVEDADTILDLINAALIHDEDVWYCERMLSVLLVTSLVEYHW